jgi:competence protein ComEC
MRLLPILVLLIAASGCPGYHPLGVDDFKSLCSKGGEPPPKALVLTFFETGLGDSVLVEFPSGRTLLVDAGIGWFSPAILNYLESRGARQLDGLLLTHPHMDHFGGMKAIVDSIPVSRFYWNGARDTSSGFEALEQALSARNVPRTVLRRGDNLDGLAGEGVSIEVLYPDEQAFTGHSASFDANRGSIVLRITHGSSVFLLMGDAEHDEDKRLLALEGGRMRADVIKVGHHGSLGSVTAEFIAAVRPRVAVVQGTAIANLPPIYPRPSYYIRSIFARMKTPLLNPRMDGTVQIISDGETIRWRCMTESGHFRRQQRIASGAAPVPVREKD